MARGLLRGGDLFDFAPMEEQRDLIDLNPCTSPLPRLEVDLVGLYRTQLRHTEVVEGVEVQKGSNRVKGVTKAQMPQCFRFSLWHIVFVCDGLSIFLPSSQMADNSSAPRTASVSATVTVQPQPQSQSPQRPQPPAPVAFSQVAWPYG